MSKSESNRNGIAVINTKLDFIQKAVEEMKTNIKEISESNAEQFVTQKEFFLYKVIILGLTGTILLFVLNAFLNATFK